MRKVIRSRGAAHRARARQPGGPAVVIGFDLRPPAGASDASGSPVAYLYLGSVDDHRDGAIPLGELEHFGEEPLVLQDVEVLDVVPVLGVGLTGRGGVGSGVLAENADRFG